MRRRVVNLLFVMGCVVSLSQGELRAQTGSVHEPIRYVGGPVVNHNAHDGQLRPAIGVETFQVMRANRTHPEQADKFGWTYNHAPMIVYWNGKFLIEYLSNPVGEHIAPGQTLLCSSVDGRRWETPQVVFPIYELQSPDPLHTTAMMHQRMGFFITADDRLLLCAFYGHAPNPFSKGGIGRVVREAYKDGTFGPIYFLRYNEQSGWGEKNTRYPFFTRSTDEGFVVGCQALLDNKLMRQQWYDEEKLDDDAFSAAALKQRQAFNWYHRKDGKLVGIWKWSLAALSSDEGKTWSSPVKIPSLQMTGAKISGRKTSDGRFALIYNPNLDDDHRWPLAMVTGEDGILFDNMLCVHGEVPPRRFAGRYKDFGPQYNRCVEEGNGSTPGTDLWNTYSINKEDIWVSRIPVPVRYQVAGEVGDTFEDLKVGGPVTDWNIYSPRWAAVGVVEFPDAANKCLELQDKDPYDYARAIRVFHENDHVSVGFRVNAGQKNFGRLEIDVTDRYGHRAVRLSFTEDGKVNIVDGAEVKTVGTYEPGEWVQVALRVDLRNQKNLVMIGGKQPPVEFAVAEQVKSVERISFRTGPVREGPTLKTTTEGEPDRVSPDPDMPEPLAVFRIDDVRCGK